MMSETKPMISLSVLSTKADDVGLAGAQAHAGAVRPVADLPGDELHAPPRLLRRFPGRPSRHATPW